MKDMPVHLQSQRSPQEGRNPDDQQYPYHKKGIPLAEKKGWNDQIADGIIIGRNKDQITEFYRHRSGDRHRIAAENNYPQQVNPCPEKNMIPDDDDRILLSDLCYGRLL